MTAMSRDLVEKDYVVALFHLVRVACVLLDAIDTGLCEGEAAVIRSNEASLAWQALLILI